MEFLKHHCRVCGKLFGNKTKYDCKKYSRILEVFEIDPTSDSDDVHPEAFCNTCYLTAKRTPRTKQIRNPVKWLPHSDVHCAVCDERCKGGRPKKLSSCGRPSLLHTHIRSVACDLPKFTLEQVVDETYIENIKCSICKSAINNPIEVLPCKSLICCSCLLLHLDKEMTTFHCPGCSEQHDSNNPTFSRLSPVAEKMLNNMVVNCEKCYRPVKLSISNKNCDHHEDLRCSKLTELVDRPIEAEPTDIEKHVATNVVTRLLHHNDNMVVKLPTGGQVSQL